MPSFKLCECVWSMAAFLEHYLQLPSFFLSFFSIEIEPYVPEVLATHARPRVPPEKSR